MNQIEYQDKKLRLAQDLGQRVLEAFAVRLAKFNGKSFDVPPFEAAIEYLNDLASKKLIEHYRIEGLDGPVYLFDNVTIKENLQFYNIPSEAPPEVIPIIISNNEITVGDDIPEELSHIHPIYKMPNIGLNTGPCVYFLCDQNKVVYVGQAVEGTKRIPQHVGQKKFSVVYYIRVPQGELDTIEGALIALLQPKYNKNGYVMTASKEETLAELNIKKQNDESN
jgi:hypothetical protein